MKAICSTPGGVELQNVPMPVKAEPKHLLIKMGACGINPGDKSFIGRTFPIGLVLSKYEIYGVSGVGNVVEAGDNVPEEYIGKHVAIYRSLVPSNHIVGTWSQYAHVHYLDCVILPDSVDMLDYSGSLVNIITPYAFLKQIQLEGHKAIITTAGTSATGIAMAGICLAYNIPHIAIVRTAEAKEELLDLGARHVLVQGDADFKNQLKDLAQALSATAVFDGVGGTILNDIIDVLPNNTTIYAYGFLGGSTPLTVHTSALIRGITIKGFSNFRSATVLDLPELERAMQAISEIIHMPHFKTKRGPSFKLEDIADALAFSTEDGAKAILHPFK
ncbi:zinc-binding dehydrogenase [Mucilaginibacter flavus]|nr:zinc-binding dehydrogenase [Mucilaginibacter flavus]